MATRASNSSASILKDLDLPNFPVATATSSRNRFESWTKALLAWSKMNSPRSTTTTRNFNSVWLVRMMWGPKLSTIMLVFMGKREITRLHFGQGRWKHWMFGWINQDVDILDMLAGQHLISGLTMALLFSMKWWVSFVLALVLFWFYNISYLKQTATSYNLDAFNRCPMEVNLIMRRATPLLMR